MGAGEQATQQLEKKGMQMATKGIMASPGMLAGLFSGCGCVGIGLLFMGMVALGVFALNNEGAMGSETGTGSGATIVSEEIPEELKPIIWAAGDAYGMRPELLAAIHWREHSKTFKTIGPFASNTGTNASGPFQFLEKTWEGYSCGTFNGLFETNPSKICTGYGQDGGGETLDDSTKDGVANVQSWWDSAFAAAELLGGNGASDGTEEGEKNAICMFRVGNPNKVGPRSAYIDWCFSNPEITEYVNDAFNAYIEWGGHG